MLPTQHFTFGISYAKFGHDRILKILWRAPRAAI